MKRDIVLAIRSLEVPRPGGALLSSPAPALPPASAQPRSRARMVVGSARARARAISPRSPSRAQVLPASVKSLLRVLREGGWDASTRDLTVNAAAAPSHDEWLSVILEMFDEGMINVGFSGGRPIEVWS